MIGRSQKFGKATAFKQAHQENSKVGRKARFFSLWTMSRKLYLSRKETRSLHQGEGCSLTTNPGSTSHCPSPRGATGMLREKQAALAAIGP